MTAHRWPRWVWRLPRALAAAALVAACSRHSPPPSDPPLAVRDAAGAVTLALAPDGAGYRWWHVPAGTQGTVLSPPVAPGGGLALGGPAGLVIQRVDGVLRLGDARGIPHGRVAMMAGQAVLTDAGGAVLVRATAQGGRVALSDRDGRLQGFVTGGIQPERAALTAHPELETAQRATVLVAAGWP